MPLRNEIHIDTLLGNVSVKYRNDNLVAMQVFGEVPVKKDSDLYRIYDRNFRLPETTRADKAKSRIHDFHVSTATYVLEHHALKDYVSDRQAQNYDLADLRRETVEELTEKIMIRMEKSVADLFTSTSWSQNTSLSAAQQWSLDTTTSNPVPQMDTGSCSVIENSGMDPNISIVPKRVLLAAKNHSSIIERIKYTSISITEEMLAGLFGVENMVVPKAVIDSSAEGQTESIAPLWGDNVFIGFKSPRASILTPSAGYIFRDAKPLVKRWRDEERESEAIEVNMHYQAKVVASLAGYLLNDALA